MLALSQVSCDGKVQSVQTPQQDHQDDSLIEPCVSNSQCITANFLLFNTHHISPAGISLGMHPAHERRPYNVTTSLIGWAHT